MPMVCTFMLLMILLWISPPSLLRTELYLKRRTIPLRDQPRQLPLTRTGIRLIDLIFYRFVLMFLPTGVIHVTTATRSRRNQ